MKSARMTIMIDPQEKAHIQRRARAQAMSTGEYVRRASQSYEGEIDERLLGKLIDEFADNVAAMRKALRESADYLEARLAEAAAIRETVHGPR